MRISVAAATPNSLGLVGLKWSSLVQREMTRRRSTGMKDRGLPAGEVEEPGSGRASAPAWDLVTTDVRVDTARESLANR